MADTKNKNIILDENKNTIKDEVKVYKDKVLDTVPKPIPIRPKNYIVKFVLIIVAFVVLSFANLILLSTINVLPQGIYNIYATLYILTRVMYVVLFFIMKTTGEKKDLYNFSSFFVIVELILIIVYILFLQKSVLISVIISIVFIISSLNFSKNLFVRKESVSLVANYILSLAFNIVIILFAMVFLFYAFTNVPVLKQITMAIQFLIETGVKAQETAGKVSEATKNAVEGAKDSIGNIGKGLSDFFSGIPGFFGVK